MKDHAEKPHPGPFRIPRVDSGIPGILFAIAFLVLGLAAFSFAKWFLLAALAFGIVVVLVFRLVRKD